MFRTLVAITALGALVSSASAQDSVAASQPVTLENSPAAISMAPAPQPDAPKPRSAYGREGSQWLEIGGGAADNFNDAVDSDLFFSWSTFLADDIELQLEGSVWYFNQPGDNQGGIAGVGVFRWHFIHEETWTVYASAGIGLLGATGNVPTDGSSFDFMPRAGIGVTKQLTDEGLRLDLGLRWHHISNARIFGDGDNPARDGLMLYAGLIFPF